MRLWVVGLYKPMEAELLLAYVSSTGGRLQKGQEHVRQSIFIISVVFLWLNGLSIQICSLQHLHASEHIK